LKGVEKPLCFFYYSNEIKPFLNNALINKYNEMVCYFEVVQLFKNSGRAVGHTGIIEENKDQLAKLVDKFIR
jgi:uncharacterized membrane-anchored protein YjiN (DUF445 family)